MLNELEVQMCGMSRSGNHAIANWIYRQAPQPKLLLNCAEGKTDPFASCRPLSTGLPWRTSPDQDVEAERGTGPFRRKALLMHTYEDSWLRHAFSTELEEAHDEWLGPSRRRIEVLVVRDPFNLFASRLRMGASLSAGIARRIWKQHARAALVPKAPRGHERMAILYNRWCTDRAYRAQIARQLGLEFTDEGVEDVPACNGGSSFDTTSFDGRASEMATTDRWQMFRDDDRYWQIFDEETVALSAELFGPVIPSAAAPQAQMALARHDGRAVKRDRHNAG